MVSTGLNVGTFNAIRYCLTSLLLLPCLEWALQNTVESLGTRRLLAGGVVKWDGQRLGRLSPVPYFYSRNTRLFAMVACVLIHSSSLFGEFGFGAEKVWSYKASNYSRIDASEITAYIMECNKLQLRISFLKKEPFTSFVEQTNSSAIRRERKRQYSDKVGYNYRVLNEEITSNLE